jgi:hypothetical protein
MPARPDFDYSGFVSLSDDFRPGALRVEGVDPELEGERRWDPYDVFTGRFVPPRPLRFRRDEGKTAYDFVSTTLFSPRLISQRVVDALTARSVTGWRTFPVELEDGGDGFHGLSVTGTSGPPVQEWSEEVTVPAPTPRGRPSQKLKGVLFDPDLWDGSDLFVPEGTAYVLGTAKVAAALQDIGATNVEVTPITDVLVPILRSSRT